ncbi:MAG: DNA polymerase II, partial [Spirochaetaceae bacterium]|nr:DNA polymerase II [Spirochaetaceae bacterium]
LSLDIETGEDGRLYALAMDISGPAGEFRHVAVLDESAPTGGRSADTLQPASLSYLSSELALLRFLVKIVTDFDPDIIIGWHVIGFDLSFLDRKSRELNFPLRIGRGHLPLRLVERPGSLPIAHLEGRLVIDGPVALRGAFHKFSDWRLDTVAHELLGRGKDIAAHGKAKVAEIERRFREDKGALARYNLEDAVLVTEIFQRTGILEQLLTRSLITGLPPDQVHRSVAAFDRFFLPRLHRKKYVAPNQSDISSGKGAPGGMVFSRGAGLFEDVAVLDFKSLYPTVIRTFHIDPYSLIKATENPMENPVGIPFSRSEHILPAYLEELMKKRAAAKEAGDAPLSQAVKILMNSMYGVMGSSGCRFYKSELPTAITGIGRWVLDSSVERLKSWGYEVLYGDTDSLFVKLKTEERQDADNAGRILAKRVDEYFREIIRSRFGVPSRLELEYEKRYVRLFLPRMRSGTGGEAAVKRYAGLLADGSVEIKGMEFVRSDSTALAREFQHELFRRYFAGEDLKTWIREMVSRLKEGEFDDKLVYKRRLSRPAGEYKSPPPHVRAVKLLDPDGSRDLREVEYVMTPGGPLPLELGPAEIDYNHYMEKQLRSLADDVLALEGDSFDSIIGGKQLDLF